MLLNNEPNVKESAAKRRNAKQQKPNSIGRQNVFLIINNKAMNTNQKDPGCCGSDSGCCGNITDMGCC